MNILLKKNELIAALRECKTPMVELQLVSLPDDLLVVKILNEKNERIANLIAQPKSVPEVTGK